jgi:hypothetical protein
MACHDQLSSQVFLCKYYINQVTAKPTHNVSNLTSIVYALSLVKIHSVLVLALITLRCPNYETKRNIIKLYPTGYLQVVFADQIDIWIKRQKLVSHNWSRVKTTPSHRVNTANSLFTFYKHKLYKVLYIIIMDTHKI